MMTEKFKLIFKVVLIFTALLYGSMVVSKTQDENKEEDNFKIIYYSVGHLENAYSISDKFEVKPYTIKISNRIYFESTKYIKKGTKLIIPSKDVILHKSRKYDTLYKVAKKYYQQLDLRVYSKHLTRIDIKNPFLRLPFGSIVVIPAVGDEKFIWPVRTNHKAINSSFGWRKNPFARWQKEWHTGIDIEAKKKSVVAAKSGRIIYAKWLSGYGRTVVIEHENGTKTLYAHLRYMSVRVGAYLRQGESLGESGNTGRSTGSHLHFETIDKKGTPINPEPFCVSEISYNRV